MRDDFLWSGLGLVTPLKARVVGRIPQGVNGVSIDTRTLEQGDLFFAIKGHNSDGHDFVAKAMAMGAAAAVVDEAHVDQLGAIGPLYVVRDVLAAMEELGRAARQRTKAWVCAFWANACICRFLQQSLGRAAHFGAHARGRKVWRVRNWHEPFGRNHSAG